MSFLTENMDTIINADCMDVLKQLPDKCVDLVLTDPPYGMNFKSNHRTKKFNKIESDNNLNWLPQWVNEINRIKKDDSHLYIFCSWHNVDVFKQEIEKYFPVKNILIWLKNNIGMGDLANDYAPQYELILYCNPNKKSLNGSRDSTIIKYSRTNNEFHPTQKPVDLISYLIKKSSKENDLVLDCFSGSGTTAVACHKLGRHFICVEKDPDYWAASVKRLDEERRQMTIFDVLGRN